MTEKAQPRERSRLGLTPAVVSAAIFPSMLLFVVLAISVRLTLATIGVTLVVLVLGFYFPKSKPYWQRHRSSSRIVLITLSVFLAIVWVGLAVFHWNNPRYLP